MADIFAAAGSTLEVGGVVNSQSVDFVVGDFAAQSWLAIGRLNNLGELGDEASEITFDLINEGRTQKLKGVRNAGTMQLVFAVDPDDDGQAALRAFEKTAYNYAFRLNFNDAPSGGTPSRRIFIARVMSARDAPGGANDVVRLNVALGINSNVVVVDAAA